MTAEIEKLRAELEEKTRKFLEGGGKIDERKTGEVGLGKRDHSDLRATTMTRQEVATVSGLTKKTIKALTHQKKMPQASMLLEKSNISDATSIKFRQLRYNRAEIEAWLIERAASAAKKKERRIARIRCMNKAGPVKSEGALWIEEVAELIGVSPNTVRNRVKKGRFRRPDGYVGVKPFWHAKNIK